MYITVCNPHWRQQYPPPHPMHHQPDNLLSRHKGNITTTLRGQKYGSFESKLWHFWVVTHGVLATPDYKTTSQRDFCFARLQVNKTTRQPVGRLPVELRRNYGITDWRNYGTTDRASRLETQSSVTLYTLYTFHTLLYSQLTTNCGHALALRCLLSVDCCP